MELWKLFYIDLRLPINNLLGYNLHVLLVQKSFDFHQTMKFKKWV